MTPRRPSLAVFKFASCDGCQLSFLAIEDELLDLVERVEIRYFLEATSHVQAGPYDIALVEGSITTPEDAERIRHVRALGKIPRDHRRRVPRPAGFKRFAIGATRTSSSGACMPGPTIFARSRRRLQSRITCPWTSNSRMPD